MPAARTTLLVVLTAVASFLLGRCLAPAAALRGAEAPVVEVASRHPEAAEASAAPRPATGAEPLRRRVVELERQVRAFALLAAAAPVAAPAAKAVPPPLPFPSGLRADAAPERFKQTAAEVLPACFPELHVEDADCSEYPCIAWSSYDAVKGGHFNFSTCEGWNARVGKQTVVVGLDSADGKTGFFGVAALPEDPAQRKVAEARLRARKNALGEAYGIRAP